MVIVGVRHLCTVGVGLREYQVVGVVAVSSRVAATVRPGQHVTLRIERRGRGAAVRIRDAGVVVTGVLGVGGGVA